MLASVAFVVQDDLDLLILYRREDNQLQPM